MNDAAIPARLGSPLVFYGELLPGAVNVVVDGFGLARQVGDNKAEIASFFEMLGFGDDAAGPVPGSGGVLNVGEEAHLFSGPFVFSACSIHGAARYSIRRAHVVPWTR